MNTKRNKKYEEHKKVRSQNLRKSITGIKVSTVCNDRKVWRDTVNGVV